MNNHDENKTLHVMTTRKCNKKCPLCCNKFYNIDELPVVTEDMFKWANIVCITGGEPNISFPGPRIDFVKEITNKFQNIKEIYFYVNGSNLSVNNITWHNDFYKDRQDIKVGYTISPKDEESWTNLLNLIYCDIDLHVKDVFYRVKYFAKYSRIYVFEDTLGSYKEKFGDIKLLLKNLGFDVQYREWETKPRKTPKNVIYSRLNCLV